MILQRASSPGLILPKHPLQRLLAGEREALRQFDEAVAPRPYLVNMWGQPAYSTVLWRPEEYQQLLGLDDRRMEAFMEALRTGNSRAKRLLLEVCKLCFSPTASIIIIQSGRFSTSFSPYSDTDTTVHSSTTASPVGAGHATITSIGGGGGGGNRAAGAGGAGGAGVCKNTSVAITGGTDNIGYTVGGNGVGKGGTSGAGTNGAASTTSSGTGGFAGITHSAGGGTGSSGNPGGTGGTATGGGSNFNGSAGIGGSTSGDGGGAGNAAASPTSTGANGGGNGGAGDSGLGGGFGSIPGGGGGGGSIDLGAAGGDGGSGKFQVDWAV